MANATRRRGDALVTAIREATRAELAENGYPGVTFEGVARRAGTSKPVLYRRYRSRAHLVLDSWSTLSPLLLPTRTAGSLRDDLVGVLAAILERFEELGVVAFRGVVAELDDELLDEITTYTWTAAAGTITRILRDARARGEIGAGPVPERALLLPLVMLRHEVFFSRGPVTRRVLEEIVDTVCVPLWRSIT